MIVGHDVPETWEAGPNSRISQIICITIGKCAHQMSRAGGGDPREHEEGIVGPFAVGFAFWLTIVAVVVRLRTGCKSTPKACTPLRAEPNGFRIHHLSHSGTVSDDVLPFFMLYYFLGEKNEANHRKLGKHAAKTVPPTKKKTV